ncbi:MAG: hypothetical protein ABI772_07405 [Bacteroidota bacterium]
MIAFRRALFTHLILASASSLMTMLTLILAEESFNVSYITLVFFSAILVYRLAYYGLPFKLNSLNTIDRYLAVISVCILCITVFFICADEVAGLAVVALACLAYFAPLRNGKGLRSITFLKSVWLAVVWALVTVWIPLHFSTNREALFILGERFLFMLAICIIYNLRDLHHDTVTGIKTVLHKLGVPVTKLVCILILMMAQLLILFHHYPEPIYISLSVSMAATGLTVIAARRNGSWWYYTLLVDGSMIIQYLLVVFAVQNSVN